MIVYQCIRALIDMLIRDMIEATEERLSSNDFKSAQEIMAQKNPVAVFSETMREKKDKLNHFLFTRFYTHFKIMRMQFKAARLLKDLFREFSERPSQLPPQVQKRLELKQDSVQRIVCDHIAGMTDRFALNEHRTLFLPYEY
jgi:dGTPase